MSIWTSRYPSARKGLRFELGSFANLTLLGNEKPLSRDKYTVLVKPESVSILVLAGDLSRQILNPWPISSLLASQFYRPLPSTSSSTSGATYSRSKSTKSPPIRFSVFFSKPTVNTLHRRFLNTNQTLANTVSLITVDNAPTSSLQPALTVGVKDGNLWPGGSSHLESAIGSSFPSALGYESRALAACGRAPQYSSSIPAVSAPFGIEETISRKTQDLRVEVGRDRSRL
ncbi:hypothetical protein R3P38DRAFT_2764812 [Favolaschia claudopus]|uniref:Uncharacterized protein n=1 Tax=Favolaschia claudopus TaxID=2862362 RepID=A0AAW0DDC8_9AGAR